MSHTISIDTKNTRTAFVTDDGTSISPHFGRALYYEVITIASGAVVSRERREKAGHHTFHTAHEHGSHDPSSEQEHESKHNAIIDPIRDCNILVARGMGTGAHGHLTRAHITPILTSCTTIDEALARMTQGGLDDHPERLH